MKINLRILYPALAALVVLTSCNAARNNQNAGADSTGSSAPQPEAPADAASTDVSFLDGNGKSITLQSLKGKVVFINFWATWCPPCIDEMPSINRLKQTFKSRDDIVFLMVDVDGDYGKSKAFMDKNRYDLPVYTPDSDIPPSFLGNAIPTTVILDKAGELVVRAEGGRDYMAPGTVKAIEDLLNH